MNHEKQKHEKRKQQQEEDLILEQKLAREREIIYQRYEQERQRDIQLKAKAQSSQDPTVTSGGLTPSESKRGILKPKVEPESKQRSKRNIRFEDQAENNNDGNFSRQSPAGTQDGFAAGFGSQADKNSNGSSSDNNPQGQGLGV